MSEKCQLCLASCLDGQVLSDGSRYHQRCYTFVIRRRDELILEISYLSVPVNKLNHSIKEFTTAIGFVRRLIDGSKYEGLIKQHEGIVSSRNNLAKKVDNIDAALRKLWDVWPNYPPDWEDRRRSIIVGVSSCPNCYQKTNFLHVHHKVPLSRGGSNRRDNLELLCEKCHSDEHGGKIFRYDSHRQAGSFSKTIDLLGEAIRFGKDVRFSYEKYGQQKTKRLITPKRIAPYEHGRKKGRTLCVEGFCHLRNADRTFAIKRISGTKIIY